MRGILTRLAACAAFSAFAGGVACPVALAAGSTAEPRRYEMVSPASKAGNDVSAYTARTRAAVDGSAVGFVSLGGFGDVIGTSIAIDYMSVRTSGGWRSHAITPQQDALPFYAATNGLDPTYEGEFAPDLSVGVFRALSPVPTADDPHPNVAATANLYRRANLLVPGSGTYELLTDCPACVSPLPPTLTTAFRPFFAQGNTGTVVIPPFQHIVFESRHRLLAGAVNAPNLYESYAGSLYLVGRVPSSGAACDDTSGPACVPSGTGAVAGQGITNARYPQGVISADGARVVFMVQAGSCGGLPCGDLFLRSDRTRTDQINASEKGAPDTHQPAVYWSASADGHRIFFTSPEQLVEDDTNSAVDLYMYDVTKATGQRLTRLSVDARPEDDLFDVAGVIGVSNSGDRVYFTAPGQLAAGAPLLDPDATHGIYLWQEGQITYIGSFMSTSDADTNMSTPWTIGQLGSRVTPSGSHMAFTATNGSGLTGYDHSASGCGLSGEAPCAQIYLYEAESRSLMCASCNPNAPAATADATFNVKTGTGFATSTWHRTHALSDDGSALFFSTREALVLGDVNGKVDAYEFNSETGKVELISSGTSTANSYFLDAGATGRDTFFVTRERLVGWDVDSSYDLYDARVGGGFAEPAVVVPCRDATCQGAAPKAPASEDPQSEAFAGGGNLAPSTRSEARRRKTCRRGAKKRKQVKGRVKCVKRRSGSTVRGI